jgi:formate hydrogenlyase subunit 6/NADH:ubiquinone oxidoreductase subunit I
MSGENGHQSVLIIGGGIAGIQATLDLANMGFKVYLVEKTPSIGGKMSQLDKTFPTNDCSMCILAPKMIEAAQHPNVKLLTYSEVEDVSGEKGKFKVKVRRKAPYIDWEKCTGCGVCVESKVDGEQKEFDGELWVDRVMIDEAACIQCGDCARACLEENKTKHAMNSVFMGRQELVELPADQRAGKEPEVLSQKVALMSEKERAEFWQKELTKCIKCFGCRDACPVWVFGKTELEDPEWVATGRIPPVAPLFQIIRAYRVGENCVNCGQCEDACPMHIPLRTIHQLIWRRPPESVFEYVPGLDEKTKKKLIKQVKEQPVAQGR